MLACDTIDTVTIRCYLQCVGKSLVTVDEAGRSLGVSRSTVWRMIRRGELPSIRKGGRRLIASDALQTRSVVRESARIPPFTLDNPIFRLIGAFRSGGGGPGSGDKHALLAKRK